MLWRGRLLRWGATGAGVLVAAGIAVAALQPVGAAEAGSEADGDTVATRSSPFDGMRGRPAVRVAEYFAQLRARAVDDGAAPRPTCLLHHVTEYPDGRVRLECVVAADRSGAVATVGG